MTETTQDDAMATTRSAQETRLPGAPRRRLFVMRSAGGARLFAVYADEVEGTSENLTPAPLPFAPAPVLGVVSQRGGGGRILTVIDPLLLFPDATPADAPAAAPAAPPSAHTPAPLIVALRGDEQLALSVEGVEHDIELYDDDDADAGAETDAGVSHSILPLRRIVRHDLTHIALLDPARLFDAAMRGVERRRRRT